ncbi:hypothetical protein BQ1740_1964 [Bacillus subtilis]|nr:hypothetical protein BQ1740_1964 [Bacillus subtilis]
MPRPFHANRPYIQRGLSHFSQSASDISSPISHPVHVKMYDDIKKSLPAAPEGKSITIY